MTNLRKEMELYSNISNNDNADSSTKKYKLLINNLNNELMEKEKKLRLFEKNERYLFPFFFL